MTIELNGDEETTDATVNAHNDGSDESIDIGVSIGV